MRVKVPILSRVAQLRQGCIGSALQFPEAGVKIFLDASAEERAERRYKQLKEKGLDANLADLIAEIRERDDRDRNRSVAPLMAPKGSLEVDSTALSIDEVLEKVLEKVRSTFPDFVV